MELTCVLKVVFLTFAFNTCVSSYTSRFYEHSNEYEYDCSVQFDGPRNFDCACISGLWKLYASGSECMEFLTIGGDNQYCFTLPGIAITRAELLLEDKSHISIQRSDASLVYFMDEVKEAINVGPTDTLIAGMEWTLEDEDGNEICIATREDSYCFFSGTDLGMSGILKMKKGCQDDLASVIPSTCKNINSESKNICSTRIVKRDVRKQGRVFFGGLGLRKMTRKPELTEIYDEDYSNTTSNVSSSDAVASEIWNFMENKLDELLGLKEGDDTEPTTSDNPSVHAEGRVVGRTTVAAKSKLPKPALSASTGTQHRSRGKRTTVKNAKKTGRKVEFSKVPKGKGNGRKIESSKVPKRKENGRKIESPVATKGIKKGRNIETTATEGTGTGLTAQEYRTPVFQFLEMARDIMIKTCPTTYVTPDFFNLAVTTFIKIQKKHFKFPDVATNYQGYIRIRDSLRECITNVTTFNFTSDSCQSREKPVNGRYCAFGDCQEMNVIAGFENFEPIIETVWNLFKNSHAACYKFFNKNFNDHHRYTMWMMPLFQNDVHDAWLNGSAKGVIYGGIFGNQENTQTAIAYCTASSQMLSTYPWDLPRPNKISDLAKMGRRKRDVVGAMYNSRNYAKMY